VIELGQAYEGKCEVRDADGKLTDPDTASCTISLPDGTTDDVTVPLPSVVEGVLRITYRPTLPGPHKCSWAASLDSVPDVATSDYFNVREYISLLGADEAREFLNDYTTSLDLIRSCCAAATRITEQKVGTCVPRLFTDDEIPGRFATWLRLPHGPALSRDAVTSIASVWPGGPSWGKDDLIVSMATGKVRPVDGIPFRNGPWLSTYLGGRAPVGENITAGCRQVLWDLWGVLRGSTRDTDEPSLADLPAIEAGYRLSVAASDLLGGELLAIPGFA
jgi:hypothetical protein